MHFFTSITSNYLPKARVLAASVKLADPSAVFHLVLSDVPPPGLDLATEPFDSLITVEELPIESRKGWIFQHSVVELCTAVKGFAFLEIHRRHAADKVLFLDPDIVVFGGLGGLEAALDRHCILLTPHLTAPEQTLEGIIDNEICALQHGVYNLGFLGVRTSEEGLRFLRWWADRLQSFCRDDIPRGLFTDQRWADLVPAFFEGVKVLRGPQYNVATWNLSNRVATGSLQNGILINGEPLAFYHFSGFDSGAQESMLNKYGKSSPVLQDLRTWYVAECATHGQEVLGKRPSKYGFFDDGVAITRAHRLVYRERKDLQSAFPDPFNVTGSCFRQWFDCRALEEMPWLAGTSENTSSRVLELEEELRLIKGSRSWRLARVVARIGRAFG